MFPCCGRAIFEDCHGLRDDAGVGDDGDALAGMTGGDARQSGDDAVAKLLIRFAAGPGEVVVVLSGVAGPDFGMVMLDVAEEPALEIAAENLAQGVVVYGSDIPAARENVRGGYGAKERARVERGGSVVGRAVFESGDLLFAARAEGQVEPAAETTAVGAGVDVGVSKEEEPGALVAHA